MGAGRRGVRGGRASGHGSEHTERSTTGRRKSSTTQKEGLMPTPTPFLWFDKEAEEAADHYTSIFPNSRIQDVARYGSVGPGEEGMVMTVAFELDGQRF